MSSERARPMEDPQLAGVLGSSIGALLRDTKDLAASDITRIVDVAGEVLRATSARVLLADYGLRSLQALGDDGPWGRREPIEGTLAGRCFASGEIVEATGDPNRVWIPLTEGSERLGVLELDEADWDDDLRSVIDPIIRVLVLVLISNRRYTDVVLRLRRSEPLSIAAEIQWSLLPPLTCSTEAVSVSGILEPAYTIGGDSFDYATNPGRTEFAIIDAVGHGLAAVSIAVLALNSLRNARREGHSLDRAYLDTGEVLRVHVGRSAFATGQFASLDHQTGRLDWLNAGHPLPLLVRNHSFVKALPCQPSLPMGLGGAVAETASEHLQPGDRVLFYTDGVTESRSPDHAFYGTERLVDALVRVSSEEQSPAETVRRLAATLLAYNGGPLRDDATLLLVEYHGPPGRASSQEQ